LVENIVHRRETRQVNRENKHQPEYRKKPVYLTQSEESDKVRNDEIIVALGLVPDRGLKKDVKRLAAYFLNGVQETGCNTKNRRRLK
jgi:hypothetical protein